MATEHELRLARLAEEMNRNAAAGLDSTQTLPPLTFGGADTPLRGEMRKKGWFCTEPLTKLLCQPGSIAESGSGAVTMMRSFSVLGLPPAVLSSRAGSNGSGRRIGQRGRSLHPMSTDKLFPSLRLTSSCSGHCQSPQGKPSHSRRAGVRISPVKTMQTEPTVSLPCARPQGKGGRRMLSENQSPGHMQWPGGTDTSHVVTHVPLETPAAQREKREKKEATGAGVLADN